MRNAAIASLQPAQGAKKEGRQSGGPQECHIDHLRERNAYRNRSDAQERTSQLRVKKRLTTSAAGPAITVTDATTLSLKGKRRVAFHPLRRQLH